MAGKELDMEKTQYPIDDNWVDYKADINDGWADDVPLTYDDNGWKPDAGELTAVDIDSVSDDTGDFDDSVDSEDNINDNISHDDEGSVKKSNKKFFGKVHYFRLFMILWLGLLSITISILLGHFYDFLEKYEDEYENTRPSLKMDEIIKHFEDRDYDTIYTYITNVPEISEFESEDNIKNYISSVMGNDIVRYSEVKSFNGEFPDYHIMSGDYIIADMSLRKSKSEYAKYKFPKWYISSCDFYMDPQFSCIIDAPINYEVYVNDVLVSADYITEKKININTEKYYDGFGYIPFHRKYKIEGLYEKPIISAKDCFGNDAEVQLNKRTGIYEVVQGSSIENEDELKDFSISFVSDYSNYISSDHCDNPLSYYTHPESDIIDLINSGTGKKYFNSHIGSEIRNAKVEEFTVYTADAVYCRVSLDQAIIFNTYGEEAVVHVDLRLYLVNTDEGWKICRMQF